MKKPQHLTVMVHETGKPTIDVTSDLAEALNEITDITTSLRNFIARHCMDIKPSSEEIRLKGMQAIDNARTALKKAGYTE